MAGTAQTALSSVTAKMVAIVRRQENALVHLDIWGKSVKVVSLLYIITLPYYIFTMTKITTTFVSLGPDYSSVLKKKSSWVEKFRG